MLKQNQKLSGIPAVICILFLNSPRSNRYCSPCSNNQTDQAQGILKNKSKGILIYKNKSIKSLTSTAEGLASTTESKSSKRKGQHFPTSGTSNSSS